MHFSWKAYCWEMTNIRDENFVISPIQTKKKLVLSEGHQTSNIGVRMFANVHYFFSIELFDFRMFAIIVKQCIALMV